MTAREKFLIGQRVRVAAAWIELGKKRRDMRGTVKGFGTQLHFLVRVHVDGNSSNTIEGWHMDFWEIDDAQAQPTRDARSTTFPDGGRGGGFFWRGRWRPDKARSPRVTRSR